jgi:hypothetical protein
MLGVDDARELSEQFWQELLSRVELPQEIADAQRKTAGEPVRSDCQRRYGRRSLASPAILADGVRHHACRGKDISRIGVGFYCPINVLPKKIIRLWLPHGGIFLLRVTRCRRLGERCYEVGSRFHAVAGQ